MCVCVCVCMCVCVCVCVHVCVHMLVCVCVCVNVYKEKTFVNYRPNQDNLIPHFHSNIKSLS